MPYRICGQRELSQVDISEGELISISHSSKVNPFRSIVCETKDNLIAVRLIREFALLHFSVGDTAVLTYEKGDSIHIFNCVLRDINLKLKCIVFEIGEFRVIANERAFERFFTSTYCEIETDNAQVGTAILKDISLNGAQIISSWEYDLDKSVKAVLFVNDISVSMQAIIVRKVKNSNFFDYGIQFDTRTREGEQMLKVYIQNLKDEQEKLIIDLKNGAYGSFVLGRF